MENIINASIYSTSANGARSPAVVGTVVATNDVAAAPRQTVVPASPCSSGAPESIHRKRARKDRGPNWSPQEVLALYNAKRDMFLKELDTVDPRDLMSNDSTKWQQISQEVMKCGISLWQRDAASCKTKWNQIVPEYKKIADFFARIGTNGADYWNLEPTERKTEGLPKSFPRDLFFNLHEWYGSRPSMQPPHTRDLLSHDDGNYRIYRAQNTKTEDIPDSADENEDPMDLLAAEGRRLAHTSTGTPLAPQAHNTGSGSTARISDKGTTGKGKSRPSLPPGVLPHVISSSDTSDWHGRKRLGNTAVKRKSLSGHTLIAEATRASGEVMASQMKDMADASRDLERSKIDVQLKLFAEQMQFQREKDLRLHESSRVANENAKLAILKQGEVVQCLSQLSAVLSMGLRLSGDEPHMAPPAVTATTIRGRTMSSPEEPHVAHPGGTDTIVPGGASPPSENPKS